jgi:hypothetical protein
MRSSAMRRRFLVASIVLLNVLGLTIPISLAQTRPGATATGPAASQAGLRDGLAERVAELSKRIEDRLELQRLAGRADDELTRQEEAARGGESLNAISPWLKNNQYQLRQVEIQRDLMVDQYGKENPRYKAAARRAAEMREAYERQLAAAQSKAAAGLENIRAEAAATRKKLEDAAKREEAAKQALIESAAAAVDAR